MSKTNVVMGNLKWALAAQVTLYDMPNVGAATTAQGTAQVPGVKVGDMVFVSMDGFSGNAGYFISNAYVSAADTVSIRFGNATAGAINPAAASTINLNLLIIRPEYMLASIP